MLWMKRLPYITFFIICLAALGGCATGIWHPVRFAEVEEVYSSMDLLESKEGIPQDSIQKSLFNAPYQDVYRAVSTSVTRAQMHVKKEDKKNGVILAFRTIKTPPPPGLPNCTAAENSANLHPQDRNYYYLIMVKEKGAKSTEVTTMAKTQGRCIDGPCLVPASTCHAYASVHWATGHDNSLQELTQIMTFIRNHLLEAGLI